MNRYSAQCASLADSAGLGRTMCACPPYVNSLSSRGPHQGHSISNILTPYRSSVSDRGRAMLVDQVAGCEALQRKWRVQLVRAILRDRVREHPARSGRCLEAAGPPAAVQVQPLDA